MYNYSHYCKFLLALLVVVVVVVTEEVAVTVVVIVVYQNQVVRLYPKTMTSSI